MDTGALFSAACFKGRYENEEHKQERQIKSSLSDPYNLQMLSKVARPPTKIRKGRLCCWIHIHEHSEYNAEAARMGALDGICKTTGKPWFYWRVDKVKMLENWLGYSGSQNTWHRLQENCLKPENDLDWKLWVISTIKLFKEKYLSDIPVFVFSQLSEGYPVRSSQSTSPQSYR